MKKNKIKNACEQGVEYYFKIELYPVKSDKDKVEWAAEIPDLPGCVGGGNTPQEALAAVEDAKNAWIEIALTDETKIPETKVLKNQTEL